MRHVVLGLTPAVRTAVDPFVVLGVPPTMDLDPDDLERRYLELSRDCHPDRHRTASPEQQTALLERSARVNDAYRELRDPWRRAEVLLELRQPGVLARNKQLSPVFLSGAMELSEEVASAEGDQVAALRARLRAGVEADLASVREKIEGGAWNEAATALHQSRYHRKALADLEAKS